MAKPIKLNINVDFGDDFKLLLEIVESARELHELVPEWSAMEADELLDNILELAKDSATVNRKK